MTNNNIKYSIILLIIISIVTSIYYYLKINKNEEKKENFITQTLVDGEIFMDKNNSKNVKTLSGELTKKQIDEFNIQEKERKINYGKLSSLIKLSCNTYKDINGIVNSQIFFSIKSNLESISKEMNSSKDNFYYVTLPTLVYENCKISDDDFNENLIEMLQQDGDEIIISTIDEIKGMYDFVNKIDFDNENIDKNIIKSSKEHFNKIFFKDNLEQIISMYYFQNYYYKSDIDKYINTKALLTPNEADDILTKTSAKFEEFLKSSGFLDINDFRNILLKLNGYSNSDDIKNKLLEKYEKLNFVSKKDLNFYLNEEIITLKSLENFYKGENFNKIRKNSSAYGLLNEITELYIFFTITNGAFADNLGESWGGKIFFGDSLKGNGIIRLAYLNIFDKNK